MAFARRVIRPKLINLSATACLSYIHINAGLTTACSMKNQQVAFYTVETSPPPAKAKDHQGYLNLTKLMDETSSVEDRDRSIIIRKLNHAAIEEDVRSLFEEEGFPVKRILMGFDPQRGLNFGGGRVILETSESADHACTALQGASIFGDRVALERDSQSRKVLTKELKEFYWGWFASDNPDPKQARIRRPLLRPPSGDIFAPVRERRRIAFTELPGLSRTYAQIYNLLHGFDVQSTSKVQIPGFLRSKNPLRSITVDMMTREGAEKVVAAFNRVKIFGHPIKVTFWQPSMKHLGGLSWDQIRGGGHFSGERDQGSAVGTNFEVIEEEVLRKAILGKYDRKLWVPSHSYYREPDEQDELEGR